MATDVTVKGVPIAAVPAYNTTADRMQVSSRGRATTTATC